MPITQEEWGKLTPEEQETRMDEKPEETPPASSAPEVKEDVVVIGGKERPLKNFMAEITRKVKDEVTEEVLASTKKETPKPTNNQDYQKQILSMAEREMEETGSMLPVNTILTLISQGAGYHVKTASAANKTVKTTKRELKKEYKDFGDYEDEFDDIVESVEPQNVSKEGLKIIFNSVRGKKTDEIINKRVEEGIKKGLEDKKILGTLDTPSTSTITPKFSGKLTPAQEEEMKDMGFETPADYMGRLKKYQEIAKRKNAKNTPILLSERLIT